MSSPVSILFNTDGVEINAEDNTTLASGITGLIVAGSDGTKTHFLKTDSQGQLITTVSGLEFSGTVNAGTEYTEGDIDSSITGTAMLMEGASNTLLPVQGTIADGLLVNLGSNNDVVVTNAGTFAVQAAQQGTWNVTNISGTVSLPTGAATAALQTTGNTSLSTLAGAVAGSEVQVDIVTIPTVTVQATNLDVRDLSSVSDSITVHGDVGVIDQLDLTNSNPVTVAIVDSSGDQITSFGGGTQYTEGDVDASITGTAVLMESGVNTLVPLQGTPQDGLLVNLGLNNDVVASQSGTWNITNVSGTVSLPTGASTAALQTTGNTSLATLAGAVAGTEMQVDVLTLPSITGTVTANAGTNLNTSALALETGGNLAGAATSLAILDDWDESDRAKVNLIVGQAGVAAGAGNSSATTQRVVIATDQAVIPVSDNGGSITVDGSVTVSATNLDIRDLAAASDSIAIHGDVGIIDQFDLTNSNPAAVAIVDANGDQITSFGGGTQYTQGDTDASITGTAMLMEGGADTLLPVQGTIADGLLVNLGSNNDVTASQTGTWNITNVSGTVSLPTGASTAALQTTGNTSLATIAGAVSGTEVQVDVLTMPTVTIQDGGGSLTVDGTVTVTATNLDVRDLAAASDSVAVHGNVGVVNQFDLTNSNPLAVALVDATGNHVVVASGIQYQENSALPSLVTGPAMMWQNSSAGWMVPAGDLWPLPVEVKDLPATDTHGGTEVINVAIINEAGDQIDISAQQYTHDQISIASPIGTLAMWHEDESTPVAINNTDRPLPVQLMTPGGTGSVNVLELTNNNSVAVAIVDGNGDQITSFGGGTQYTEDAAAAANPVGTASILVRADTPATIADTDGDNIAQRGTNYGAAYVQVVSSDGSFVDTFGGGTQYTEGDTDASITGTALMLEGAANTLVAAPGTASDGMLVNLGSNNDVTVTGTVTVQDGGNVISVDDAGSSLTIDNATLSVVGGGTEATALRVTIASDSTGVLSVDDNGSTLSIDDGGGSITVDGTVAVSNSTNVAKLEDDASAHQDAGIPILVTRKATPANVSGSDGDYEFLQMSAGRLWTSTAVDTALPAGTNNIGDVDIASITAGDNTIGRVKLTDGTDVADILDLANSNPLTVAIVDANGDQITSFGGGTQYTEGDTDASITGTALMLEAAANTLVAAPGTAADGMLVNLGANNDVSVTGSVTVAQGTAANLNMTEASAASILTAVQLIDDMIYVDDTATHSTGTSKGALFMAAATPTDASVNANDIGAVAMTTDRKLHVSVQDALPAGTAFIGKVRLTDGTLDSSLVDETGTNAVDAVAVGGGTPHDSVDSGNPIKVGFKAATALPTAVASADRTNGTSDVFGRQLVTHIDAGMANWKQVEATTSQTGTAIWTPAGGKKIAVTSVLITTGGTTAGVVTIWFGAGGDTTFSQGTDQVVFRGEFAPSTTSRPGVVLTPAVPFYAATADHILRYTTSANVTIYITVYGYEF